jgi:hypothetical protein
MITGFNTDVKCGDKLFHVQTEDKGTGNPLIESLIYIKGAILDAYRTNYKDFLQSETFSESTLQKILEFQHRQIVSCIKKGKLQKGMALRAYVEGQFVFELTDFKGAATPAHSLDSPEPQVVPARSRLTRKADSTETVVQAQAIASETSHSPEVASGVGSQPLITRPNRIELVDASEAADLSAEQGIEICVEGSKEFVGGSHVDLSLFVQSRQGRLRLENVQVIVKVIGTTFSPRLYAGKTDKSGSLRMNFNLPTYSAGSAALIIQVSTALGNDEIKYLIKRR